MIEHISAALGHYEREKLVRRYDVRFRGVTTPLRVVTLRPNELFLNHSNSRVGVELDAHPDREVVIENPQSRSAQEILTRLIRQTKEFEKIKEELQDLGQVEPGVVSVDGRVINGNTRLVAIRELGWDYIDVGVLPDTATEEDFREIEYGLQLVETTKQEYTFANRLRVFEQLILSHRTVDDTCRLMGWQRSKLKSFDNFKMMLDFVNECEQLGIPKLFFDGKEEYLQELVARLAQLVKAGRVDQVKQLKEMRLIGMLSGSTKDKVRHINVDFFETFLEPRLEDAPDAAGFIQSAISANENAIEDPMSASLGVRSTSEATPILYGLIDATNRASTGEVVPGFEELKATVILASIDAEHAGQRTTQMQSPAQLITTCTNSLGKARAKIQELSKLGQPFTDEEVRKFEHALTRLKNELELLESEFRSATD